MNMSRLVQSVFFVCLLAALPCTARADGGPSPDFGAVGTFPNGATVGGVDAATGTVTAGYPFEVPIARGGVGLPLALNYAHTSGAGDAGMGWSLGFPAITRYRGLARTGLAPSAYTEYPFPRLTTAEDNFAFGGARLIEICTLHGEGGCPEAAGETFPSGLGAARYYRLQAEGSFTRFFRLASDTQWVVQYKDGITEEYGYARGLPDAGGDPVLYDTEAFPQVAVRWELSRRYDTHVASNGMQVNAALYQWRHLGARAQAYLTDIFDTSDPSSPADLSRFAHHTRLYYEAPDFFTWNAAAPRLSSKEMRLTHVDVASLTMVGTGAREQVRRFWLSYYPQPTNGQFVEGTHAPVRGQSFLKMIQMEGRCATPPTEAQGPNDPSPGLPASSACGRLPATTYYYSGRGQFERTEIGIQDPGLPSSDVYFANPGPGSPLLTTFTRDPSRAQFLDYNRDGFPDLVVGNFYSGYADVRAFNNTGGILPGLQMACVDFMPGPGGTGIASVAGNKFLGGAANTIGYWGTDTQVGNLWNPAAGTWEWTKLVESPTASCRPGWTSAASRPRLAFQTVRTAPIVGMPPVESIATFEDIDADGLVDVLYYDPITKNAFIRFTRHSLDAGGAPPRIAPFAENVPVALKYGDTTEVLLRFLQFADINGDGVPDAINFNDGVDVMNNVEDWVAPLFTFVDGRGNGKFACNSAYGSCGTPARNLLNPDGSHTLGRTPQFIGGSAEPWEGPRDNIRKTTIFFHDVNGDGLADIVRLWYTDPGTPGPYFKTAHISIWLNEDGQTFRRYCPGDASGQTCNDATDQSFATNDTVGLGPLSLRFADMNANGTDDILLVGGKYVYRLDLYGADQLDGNGQLNTHGHRPPGKLVRIDNGYGARTDFTYASVQDLQTRPGGDPWTSKSPQPAWVVEYEDSSTNVAAPYALSKRVSYGYHNAAYDPWSRRLVGFEKTTVATQGAGTVETTYAFGPCETAAGCPLSSEDDDLLARRGRPVRVDQTMGSIPVSTTTYVYDHRRLFYSAGWRPSPVYFDPLILETTFLFNPDGPASTQTVVVKTRGANNEPIYVPVVLPRSTGERIQQSWTIDNFGNATESLDWGQVDFVTADPMDNVHRSLTSYVALANGWTWRAQQYELGEKNVWGTADPDPVLRRSRVTYDAFGESTLVEAELTGTQGVSRFHASAATVAPYPPGESSDGWIVRGAYVRGVTGAVLQSRRAEVPSVDGPASNCETTDYDQWFEFKTHGRAYSGACGSSTHLDTYASYDRGFGNLTTQTSPAGLVDVAAYDEFGRLSRTYKGDRAGAGGVDSTPATITTYSPGVNGPFQILRLDTRTGPSTYQSSYRYIDGNGRTLLTVAQADPTAGDGGQWIVAGLDDLNPDGTPARVYRPRFYTGSPVAVPLTHPTGTPAAEYQYDGVGRVTQAFDSGAMVAFTKYVGLTTYYYDAEDLGTGPARDTPSYVISDGHGKPKYTTRQLKTETGVDAIHTIRLFDAMGQEWYESRVHSATGGPQADGRLFTYDSLGRLVYTNEVNAAPGANAFRYTYNDQSQLIGTSDPRGCGVNFFYDGYGREKAKDLSPCQSYHAPYTTPDFSTGDGTESFSQYDTPAAGQPAAEYDSDPGNLVGLLVARSDRGAASRFGYDSRGRQRSTSRAVSKPGLPAETLSARYAPHFFSTTATFDVAGRVVSSTTGADVPQLTAGGSQVTYQYSARGVVRSIGSSYGTLIASSTTDADGAPLTMTYGDAAATKATVTYDARRRTSSFTLDRTAPAFWTATAVAPYTKPAATTTQQTVLAKYVLGYDEMSRPATIEDQAVTAQWPAGARPALRTYAHDSLGRVVSATAAYKVGTTWADDPQTSPYAYENGIGDTRPIPARVIANRTRGQTVGYDWQGNTTSITDATNSVFDRSLSDITNGDGADGYPNQLRSAGAGAISAHYDDAGNLEDLTLSRTGSCTGGKCIQRFAYEWDEEGVLVRARRWDYTTLPGAEPVYPYLPARTADWEDSYAYSGTSRVRKTDRNSAGQERHTLEVFDSLRVNRATFDTGTGDYLRTDANETAYLAGIARAQYIASGVPVRSVGDTTHVFFSAGDHLGSTNLVFDGKTSELVEKVSQDPFGRTESDYRPARWAGYREDYRFTGKEEDIEVGATYFGARYYSPYLGRFMSPDPLWIHGGGGDSNPYAYVGGMLSHATDPFGLDSEPENIRVVGAPRVPRQIEYREVRYVPREPRGRAGPAHRWSLSSSSAAFWALWGGPIGPPRPPAPLTFSADSLAPSKRWQIDRKNALRDRASVASGINATIDIGAFMLFGGIGAFISPLEHVDVPKPDRPDPVEQANMDDAATAGAAVPHVVVAAASVVLPMVFESATQSAPAVRAFLTNVLEDEVGGIGISTKRPLVPADLGLAEDVEVQGTFAVRGQKATAYVKYLGRGQAKGGLGRGLLQARNSLRMTAESEGATTLRIETTRVYERTGRLRDILGRGGFGSRPNGTMWWEGPVGR